MRKVIYNRFGDANVLELTEQAVPVPEQNQLLIRVKAVSINPLDWKVYGGEMKLMSGSKFPKSVGIDFSGIVEKTGSHITGFKTGDEIIGMLDVFKGGALADYVVVKETDIVLKPANTSFAEAAALPVTGLSALQIMDQLAAVQPNQEILINGASGGIGIFAVQIARQRGAKVTAVVSTKSLDEAKQWGADKVIDYKKQDIQQLTQKFDAVIDLSGRLTFKAAKKRMKDKATFVTTLPEPQVLLYSFFNNLFSGKKLKILIVKPTVENLKKLTGLAEQNLQIVLDKTYFINEVRKAYNEASKGKIIGKSVILFD
ncbi:NAD(P)-dependent alcohol dehydrogenase [Dyadobacter sediminis]|uniref:NAD(P)-dependent alcohol dehydrogenase n=1 Tax=Dyadobacter sediminis TaxID=1493691 RepID=A0A5R9KIQ0_9BACT|nr:NAD(P)-dependent alcohol dehydrogenase [Dyadobacter sediminis]TLU96085.1 NAD(P)-dependent alcohol dehydrogenase [Dyadobacter sediminis]GGB79113.1 quinone oxidoreductase [Dyadobacter sediminis]